MFLDSGRKEGSFVFLREAGFCCPKCGPWTSSITITWKFVAAAAKSRQSCLTLCDPIDGSPPGSAIPGILQSRTLEWVAISFSNAWKWKVKVKSISHVRLLATPWTVAYQAPPSMGFSRQEYWSGVPFVRRAELWAQTSRISELMLTSALVPSVCVCVCTQLLIRVPLFATPWTLVCQAPLSMEFSRQEYWNGLPFPSPGDLTDPGTELESLLSPALAGGFFNTSTIWEIWYLVYHL